MGRIISPVTVRNPFMPELSVVVNALVDTGASNMFLPDSIRHKLGEIEELEPAYCTFADGSKTLAKRFGPVKIQIEGFPNIYNEVIFLPPDKSGVDIEPIVGYIILEQSRVGVDMVGHRLIKIDSFDLKGFQLNPNERSLITAREASAGHPNPFEQK